MKAAEARFAARPDAAPVRLRLIGRFTVEGTPAGPLPMGKAERLLKMLAAQYGRIVLSDQLVEALWPEGAPSGGARGLAVLVSRLRRSLGREHIEGDSYGYRLTLGPGLSLDLAEAEQFVRTAESELGRAADPLAATAAEQAIRLLDGEPALADEPDSAWVAGVRAGVSTLLRRARACRWTAALRTGDLAAAVDSAGAALRGDPLDEDAARALMQAHRRAGRSGAALAAYEQLRLALAEALGTDPAADIQALHRAILQAEPAPQPARVAAGLPPVAPASLVGRDGELAELVRLWTRAAAGNGGLCLVVGEAGIGKRSLVAALAAQAGTAGAAVVTTRCFEAERSLFLQPLVEALRGILVRQTPAGVRELLGEWAGTLADLIPEVEQVLGPIPYQRAGPEAEHHRILDAVTAVLTQLSRQQPALLIVEELQNAGQSTLEALHVIATRLTGTRLLVIATSQPTGEDQPGLLADLAARLELGPLQPAAVEELVARSGTAVDAGRLASWSGGSPLMVTELLRHARGLPAGTEEWTVPASLQSVVSARIQRAGPEVAEFLQLGSVLGQAFLLDDVATLGDLPPEECARRAERAHRCRLLVAEGATFRFANQIVRQVAYRSTPEPIRLSRHRRAARLYADQPEAAAHQLVAAGDWPAAVAAWMTAAETAHRQFAHLEARRLLGEALAAAQRGPDRRLAATVLLRRGQIHGELGDYARARDDHEAAVALARELMDESLEARALEHLGWTALAARDNLRAADLADQATELAESAAAAPGALPSSLLLLGRVRHWDGDYQGAAAAYERVDGDAVDGVDNETAAHLLVCRGALLQHMDRFAEARRVLEKGVILCREAGLLRPLLQALFFTALARGDLGDFAGALRAADRARRLIDEQGVTYYSAGVDTTRSWLLRELGELDAARAAAERAVESARRGGGALELEQGLHAVLALAECELVEGRVDHAYALVDQARGYLDRPLPYRARAQLRMVEMQSRFDPARAEALLTLARGCTSRKYESLAWWHLGRPVEAYRLAERTGSDLLRAQVAPPAQARAALDRITTALPGDRRPAFLAHGRLARAVHSGVGAGMRSRRT